MSYRACDLFCLLGQTAFPLKQIRVTFCTMSLAAAVCGVNIVRDAFLITTMFVMMLGGCGASPERKGEVSARGNAAGQAVTTPDRPRPTSPDDTPVDPLPPAPKGMRYLDCQEVKTLINDAIITEHFAIWEFNSTKKNVMLRTYNVTAPNSGTVYNYSINRNGGVCLEREPSVQCLHFALEENNKRYHIVSHDPVTDKPHISTRTSPIISFEKSK